MQYFFFQKHKGVICNMTSLSNSSQSTRPTGPELWGELLVLSRFHLLLRGYKWNFYPLFMIFFVEIVHKLQFLFQRILQS